MLYENKPNSFFSYTKFYLVVFLLFLCLSNNYILSLTKKSTSVQSLLPSSHKTEIEILSSHILSNDEEDCDSLLTFPKQKKDIIITCLSYNNCNNQKTYGNCVV